MRLIADTTRGFNRIVINGSPRLLVLNSLIWIFLGTSCGMVGLGSGITFSFVLTLIFFAWAAVEMVLAHLRYHAWRKAGLIQSSSNGTVFMRVDHVFKEATTSWFQPQLVTFTLPATGDKQEVAVACATCQQNLVFRVVSQQEHRAVRLRGIVIALVCLLLGLGLSIISSAQFQPQTVADWVPWARLGSLILLFCSMLSASWTLNYIGVQLIKASFTPQIFHKARQPVKADFEQFRGQAGSAMGVPTHQNPTYQQG